MRLETISKQSFDWPELLTVRKSFVLNSIWYTVYRIQGGVFHFIRLLVGERPCA